MYWLRLARARIAGLLRRRWLEHDMDEELRFHVTMRARENVARGMDAQSARSEALRAFGNVEYIKDNCRDVRGGGMVEAFLKDTMYALRRMRKSPVFTAVAVLSLALGIGANTAIFTLVNAVLLRPVPAQHPEQLVSLYPVGKNDAIATFSYLNYIDFRDRNDVFSGMYVTRFAPMALTQQGNNARMWGYEVSANYFEVLGVHAALGRTLVPDDDRAPLSSPVAVLTHGCWQRRFAGDPSIVGRAISLNGHSFTVVGVMPEGFNGTEIAYMPELWVPMTMAEWIEPGSKWLDNRETQNIFATGRLKPGVTLAQANASLNELAAQLGREYPDADEGQTIELTPPGLIHPILREPVVAFTAVLMTVVGLVLVIACTNLANLLLSRAADRRREVAVRLALGAGRWRLIRQLLTESFVLALFGGMLGLALAIVMVRVVSANQPTMDIPIRVSLPIDFRVFGFSLLASVVTGIAFGLIPAIQSTKPELVPALKDATAQAGHGRSLLGRGLVVAQIALSLVMLIAAGLVVRTLQNLETMSPGFEPRNALVMGFDLARQGYDSDRILPFEKQLLEHVRALPGVKSASVADFVPLSLEYNSTDIYMEGDPPARGADVPSAMNASVGSDYFSTLEIPLIAGRPLDEREQPTSPKVAVVNEAFARRFVGGADPTPSAVGRRFSFNGPDGPFVEIVGVAKDGKYFSIAETPKPFVFVPMVQYPESNMYLLVRTKTDPNTMFAPIRAELDQLDATMPVYDAKTLVDHLDLSLFPARVAATLLGGFGLLALLLAAIGIYGVMSYSVSQRTREVGIRMALGARPSDVLRLIVRQGLVLNGIGVVIGIAGALAVTRLMTAILYGVSTTDVLTYVVISLGLTAVVALASYVPALRAARVEPTHALRCE